jgi:hypothetical protein
MSKKRQATTEQGQETKKRTPNFLLELPLQVNESQAARLRAHLEAGRQFYNAVLSARLPGLHSHTNAIRAAALGEEGKR